MDPDLVTVPRTLLQDALGVIRLATHARVPYQDVRHVEAHLEAALAVTESEAGTEAPRETP